MFVYFNFYVRVFPFFSLFFRQQKRNEKRRVSNHSHNLNDQITVGGKCPNSSRIRKKVVVILFLKKVKQKKKQISKALLLL